MASNDVSSPRQNVVALPGFSVPTAAGVPVETVVSLLRDALAKAESGEMRAVAIACVCGDGPNERVESDFTGTAGKSWTLYAALGRVMRRYEAWLDE